MRVGSHIAGKNPPRTVTLDETEFRGKALTTISSNDTNMLFIRETRRAEGAQSGAAHLDAANTGVMSVRIAA